MRTLPVLCGLGLTAAALLPAPAAAQTVFDLQRMSQTAPAGTARSIGVGGALTAVGGDFTAATINPAGLGLFQRNEFTATAAFRSIDNDAEFLGNSFSTNRGNFALNNLGFVWHEDVGRGGVRRTEGIVGYSVGIGFNQIGNTYRRTSVVGYNPFNSLADAAAGQANLIGYGNGSAFVDAALDGYVIDPDFFDVDGVPVGPYFPVVLGDVEQDYTLVERGRTNQWQISGALNISDRLFIGLGIGIVDYKYIRELQYTERDVNNNYTADIVGAGASGPFGSLTYDDQIEQRGVGINATLGLIYQPLDFVRIGGSITTPTYSAMTLRAYPQMYAYNEAGQSYTDFAYDYAVDTRYYQTTPFRASGGIMFLLGKYGFISGDVEVTDYANAGFDDDSDGRNDFVYEAENRAVDRTFGSAVNYRAGLELRYESVYLRGGFAYYGSPFQDEPVFADLNTYNRTTGAVALRTYDATRQFISGGLGYRGETFSIDVAYSLFRGEDVSFPYTVPDDAPLVVAEGFPGAGNYALDVNNNYIFGSFAAGAQDLNGDGVNDGVGGGYSPAILNKITSGTVYLTVGFTF